MKPLWRQSNAAYTRRLRVRWSARSWRPQIVAATPRMCVGTAEGRGRRSRHQLCIFPQSPEPPAHRSRRRARNWRPTYRHLPQLRANHPFIMKNSLLQHRRPGRGFTLIELLVVIAIIGILAGLLLPVLGKAKVQARVAQAKVEINNIAGAISKYESDYSRYPASQKLRQVAPDGA